LELIDTCNGSRGRQEALLIRPSELRAEPGPVLKNTRKEGVRSVFEKGGKKILYTKKGGERVRNGEESIWGLKKRSQTSDFQKRECVWGGYDKTERI